MRLGIKIRKVIITILILVISLCGCGLNNGSHSEMTLAVLRSDSAIIRMVEEYNVSHPEKNVTIREYWMSGNPIDYEDAMNRFISDMSGKDAPDIIYIDSQMDWCDYAEKGVFEDLSVYLENSSRLSEDDFLENALYCGKYKDMQVAIPVSFSLMTLIGDPKYVSQDGWSVDDFVKYRLDDRSVDILEPVTWEGTLTAALRYSMDEYIDWDTKTVDFEKESFYNLLTILDGIEVSDKRGTELDEMIHKGKLVSRLLVLVSATAIISYGDTLKNDMVAVGFPSSSGAVTNNIQGQYMFGINSNSRNKQDSWDFIEYVHTNDYAGVMDSFPSKKSEFNSVMQELLNTEDEYNKITKNEYEFIVDVMSNAKPWDYRTDKIIKIIEEEASSYISKEKSVEEVAGIINSRVRLIISE